MIDGVKIECAYLLPEDWQTNPLLKYQPRVDLETGEIVPQQLTATYQGLSFRIRPSSIEPDRHYMEVLGSLHRYHNKGGHNADDFTQHNLKAVIDDLQNRFQVCPERSTLRNLEFGVNIELNEPVASFIKGIICLPGKPFVSMNLDRPTLGWVSHRSEYDLKIYNKSLQAELIVNNVLRLEIRVKKMRYLKKHGISRLVDLLDTDKLTKLGCELLAALSAVVFYDGSICPSTLTARELKKLEEFTSAYRWKNDSRNRRYEAKKAMRKFFKIHGGDLPKQNALLAVFKQCLKLVNGTQQNRDVFTAFFKKKHAAKNGTFSLLECRVKTSLLDSNKNKNNRQTKKCRKSTAKSTSPPLDNKRTFCPICGRDISRQKASSKYCSTTYFGKGARRCRDKAYNRAVAERKRAARQVEENNLLSILDHLATCSISCLIRWRIDEKEYHAKFISTNLPDRSTIPINKIYKVTAQVLPNGELFEMTSRRARSFVSHIFKNQKQLSYDR